MGDPLQHLSEHLFSFADFVAMVKDSYPELQALVHTNSERRRSIRIPLDNRNSRMLRQSISNHQGQTNSIQDDLVALEQTTEQLKNIISGVPTTLPIEDEHMHEVEKYIRAVGTLD